MSYLTRNIGRRAVYMRPVPCTRRHLWFAAPARRNRSGRQPLLSPWRIMNYRKAAHVTHI